MAQTTSGTPTEDLFSRIIYHQQGWGIMGVNTCAHDSSKTPLKIKIGDKEYESGLGSHANQKTVIDLAGRYLTFQAEVGLQNLGGGPGSVVFKIQVDGQERFNSGLMRESSPAVPVSVDVKAARYLCLLVEDGNDGIINDCANWANACLIPNPDITVPQTNLESSLDIAPFGRVITTDPERTRGRSNTRLEPMSEEDLYLQQEILPRSDGLYELIPTPNQKVCIGIQWLEHRRLQRVVLEFPNADQVPPVDQVRLEYWEGISRWQENWKPFNGTIHREDNKLLVDVEWNKDQPERLSGILQFRWILAGCAQPMLISKISAFSASTWEPGEFLLEQQDKVPHGEVWVEIYNGEFLKTSGNPCRLPWQLPAPLLVSLRKSENHPWQVLDRTILRIHYPDDVVSVSLNDVQEHGSISVPHVGLRISDTNAKTAVPSPSADGTILDRVRRMPDQTLDQAMEHVLRPGAELGPTLLSLVCDNRKFLLERNGTLSWSDDPAVYDISDRFVEKAFPCRVIPTYAKGKSVVKERKLYGGWYPMPVITNQDGSVIYTQTFFVAPATMENGTSTPSRFGWDDSAMGVGEYRIRNDGDTCTDFHLRFDFIADSYADHKAVATQDGNRILIQNNRKSLGCFGIPEGCQVELSESGGSIHLKGSLEPGSETTVFLSIPRWKDAVPAILTSDEFASLREATIAHWDKCLEDAVQIDLPDTLLTNLIRASQVHCLIAARNDQGRTIAPWIASYHYGPLESEGHSIIRGMQFLGHEEFSRRALDFYIERYKPEGFLTTGYTLMGTGWHLWTLGEWVKLYRDLDWVQRNSSKVEHVCQWVMDQRAKTQKMTPSGEKVPEYGLMPPAPLADWDLFAFYFYLNGNYFAGLRAVAESWKEMGQPAADRLLKESDAYREDIQRAMEWIRKLAPVVPLQNGEWVPYYPTQVYCPGFIEFLHPGADGGRTYAYDIEFGVHQMVPMGVLDSDYKGLDWIIDFMEDDQFLREGWTYYPSEKTREDWFNLGGFAKVQPYYARNVETYALMDEVKPFLRSYFNTIPSLLNVEDLSLWEHFHNGAYNKTHETGYFLHQTSLLVSIKRGSDLWLAPFQPTHWLMDGMKTEVQNAPTEFGKVNYRIHSNIKQNQIQVEIDPPSRNLPERIVLRLRHPEGQQIQRVVGTGIKQTEIRKDQDLVYILPVGGKIEMTVEY